MLNNPPLMPIARHALSAQSDERLVRLVREGHEPAFDEIVRRYRGPLIGFATAIVSASGAEDVVQTSLAKAYIALAADDRDIALRPWLFAIVRNGALNAVRGQPRVDELDEALASNSSTSEIAESRDDFDRLVVAMCALPESQRAALVKRELEGEGHGEIAAQLGTTSTAVRGLIFRARVQLRNAMGAMLPLPLLRTLLTQGSAAGVAGGGASVALLGGAGAKGAAAISAAVLALGTGIAIESRSGGSDNDRSTAKAQGIERGQTRPHARETGSSTPEAAALVSRSGGSEPRASSGSDQGERAQSSGPQSPGSSSGSGPGAGGEGNSGRGGEGNSGGSSGGSSGPGSGHDSDDPVAEEPDDEEDSGHHGSDDHGGDDSEVDLDSDEEEPEDDSSGPSEGSGSDHDDDSSGPGGGDDDPSSLDGD